jgi:hypothetical protein
MIDRLKLMFASIIGSILGYIIINMFIIPLTFGKYFLIELLITTMHFIYQKAKVQLINT